MPGSFDPAAFGLDLGEADAPSPFLPGSYVDVTNLLLGLAYLGEASTEQVRRLWLPDDSPRYTQQVMGELRREGIVRRRDWAIKRRRPATGEPVAAGRRGSQQLVTIRQPGMWSLSERGLAMVKELEAFPPVYMPPRSRRLLVHDWMTSEILVVMLERAREAGMSGVYIGREVQLNPPARRPFMDALVIIRVDGQPARPGSVPWTTATRVRGEQRRRYAIENDRDTEELSELIAKCKGYRRANTPAWVEQYGAFPVPVLVVPTLRRLQLVMNAWIQHWEDGKWLMTTDAFLLEDRWFEYHAGKQRERTLFGA
jgi:hypothetical protein